MAGALAGTVANSLRHVFTLPLDGLEDSMERVDIEPPGFLRLGFTN
jgi:hypothetical protein